MHETQPFHTPESFVNCSWLNQKRICRVNESDKCTCISSKEPLVVVHVVERQSRETGFKHSVNLRRERAKVNADLSQT